ncbi:sulfatase [Ruania alba]|uniref:Arylsulfatase A n=1 Tax=Ruania alba TaxID=648782 RepID=A0A1H5EKQ5_9MICO|nr:sulfatase [Ruania alba]SED91608.1 Arylsulfatase A [Ruania alba]
MKAIVVMFDTLNRRYLPPYGCTSTYAPNFQRLAERTVTFDNCYAGSMPCMPARRELHTGRYNFLHRSWGPLEPFDDSLPELLRELGVYSHLVTDHQHYWEDGGATYHQRFSTFELFRGQEGDKWKGHVPSSTEGSPPPSAHTGAGAHQGAHDARRQDAINRQYLTDEADHPQTKVFDAGIEFIETNAAQDRWLVQIETFDPHEPFFSAKRHKEHYRRDYDGPDFDWPPYAPVSEPPEVVQHARDEYSALLTQCDESLGRVLDVMDAHNMWEDTMLIVCTDHGFLLGEHGWWGKIVQPWYDETIHTPLFVWDPRSGVRGERRSALVQTIDLPATLLDHFDGDPTPDMEGRSLADTVAADHQIRSHALFGSFGGHVNVTDGRYVYMRASVSPENAPLEEHTLMPTHMRARFAPEELLETELAAPFPFTKGVRPLRMPGTTFGNLNAYDFGTLLFDLQQDPQQLDPIVDDDIELALADAMVELMRANHAPRSQFERLGLPFTGPVTGEHLLAQRQQRLVAASIRT